MTWLVTAPKTKLIPETDKSPPYPLSWEEQDNFFERLRIYLPRMALFKVNTGCRDQEVCRLRWEGEIPIPELNTSVFVIPGEFTKDGLDRLVVLNDIAKQMIEEVRGEYSVYVFTYAKNQRQIEITNGKVIVTQVRQPLSRMIVKSWKKARAAVGLPKLRVHDLNTHLAEGYELLV